MLSRLARGAWIETVSPFLTIPMAKGRASQGARGLKPEEYPIEKMKVSRASQGARGLKQVGKFSSLDDKGRASQGARGLKPIACAVPSALCRSRLARGAWIETDVLVYKEVYPKVAPRKGRVD